MGVCGGKGVSFEGDNWVGVGMRGVRTGRKAFELWWRGFLGGWERGGCHYWDVR